MADILFSDDDGALIALVVDATPEERHRATAQATEQEVERGVAITDHVRPERRLLTLDIAISETPLADPSSPTTRVVDAWATLIDARDRALLAVVTTKLETYEDMVLIEAVSNRSAADGSWLRAELTFAQVRQVSTEFVDDPVPARDRDHRQTNRGSQSTAENPRLASSLAQGRDSETGQAVLESLSGFFGG